MNTVQFNTLADHPDDAELFRLYCDRDVETEAAADARMFPLSASEQETWLLSERINDRGIRIDMRSVRAALRLADKAVAAVNAELQEITGGRVETINQIQALKGWLIEQGVPVEKLGAADVVEYLELEDLPPAARRALELRQEAKSSVSKLEAFVDRVGADDRARGAFLYHAAGTGRWSSTGIQLHNMPRPRKAYEDAHLDTQLLFDAIRTAEPGWLRFLYGDDLGRPLHLLADAIRGFLWAAPGHDLVACDYSNIEGRVAAWLAGESWKIDAFRQADAGGAGVYEQTAAGIFNCPVGDIGKKDPRRQIGKVAELALGYQGGVAAFYTFARLYFLKLEPVFPTVWESAGAARQEKAEQRYEECCERNDPTTQRMSREAWLAAELIKVGWRQAHPAITGTWKELEQAARDAVEQPGTVVSACNGRIQYVVKAGYLICKLPSGRCLFYGKPQIRDVEVPWADKEQPPEKREKRPCVTVLGVDSQTKRWVRYALYGGLIFENCLGADTEVLTPYGWKPISTIQATDKVHDGTAWVAHDGLVFQGCRETLSFGGVRMTPDHKVWTCDGWRAAADANHEDAVYASQNATVNRAALRTAAGHGLRGQRWTEVLLVNDVRLRVRENAHGFGAAEGQDAELRVSARRESEATEEARYVSPQGVPCVGEHVGALHEPEAPRVQALRRPRDNRRARVGAFRDLLARHGVELPGRPDARALGQRTGLLGDELCVALAYSASAQHQGEPNDQHAEGTDASVRSGRGVGYLRDDTVLSHRRGLADEHVVHPARRVEPSRVEPVYDLLNAGPLHRFVVRGTDKRPFIVANCVQAIARDILSDGMKRCEAAGYPIVLHVHDEAVAEVLRGWGSVDEMARLLCDVGPTYDGLPIVSEGWRGKRFRK